MTKENLEKHAKFPNKRDYYVTNIMGITSQIISKSIIAHFI